MSAELQRGSGLGPRMALNNPQLGDASSAAGARAATASSCTAPQGPSLSAYVARMDAAGPQRAEGGGFMRLTASLLCSLLVAVAPRCAGLRGQGV